MKKIWVVFGLIFVCITALAHSVEWYVYGSLYQTTTCDAGDSITPPTAPAKYGYTFDKWEPAYKRLEYIESTGEQYIDTGIYLDYTKDFRVTGIIKNPSNNRRKVIFGNFTNNNNMSFSLEFASNTQDGLTGNGIRVYFSSGYSQSTDALPIDTDINIDFVYTANTKSFVLTCVANGQTYTLSGTDSNIPDITSNETLCMFLDKRLVTISNGLIIKSMSFTQETNIQSFVPAKNNSNAIGMYDTVSGTFFTNQGTGQFIAGPEVGGL